MSSRNCLSQTLKCETPTLLRSRYPRDFHRRKKVSHQRQLGHLAKIPEGEGDVQPEVQWEPPRKVTTAQKQIFEIEEQRAYSLVALSEQQALTAIAAALGPESASGVNDQDTERGNDADTDLAKTPEGQGDVQPEVQREAPRKVTTVPKQTFETEEQRAYSLVALSEQQALTAIAAALGLESASGDNDQDTQRGNDSDTDDKF